MEVWIDLIQDVGFPIFVVLWFMFRTEKIIIANTLAQTELSELVRALIKKLDDGEDEQV
jgi:hypothetical protein